MNIYDLQGAVKVNQQLRAQTLQRACVQSPHWKTDKCKHVWVHTQHTHTHIKNIKKWMQIYCTKNMTFQPVRLLAAKPVNLVQSLQLEVEGNNKKHAGGGIYIFNKNFLEASPISTHLLKLTGVFMTSQPHYFLFHVFSFVRVYLIILRYELSS